MKVKIVHRHTAPSDAVRRYVLHKTEALERYYDRIISVDVVLSHDRERRSADFHAHLTNRKMIAAHEETSDIYASIDKAVGRLKRQLVKYKDQLRDNRGSSTDSVQPADLGARVDHKEIVRKDTYFHKPMTPDEAALQLEAIEKGFLVFIDAETDQVSIIYHLRDGNYGLIAPRR